MEADQQPPGQLRTTTTVAPDLSLGETENDDEEEGTEEEDAGPQNTDGPQAQIEDAVTQTTSGTSVSGSSEAVTNPAAAPSVAAQATDFEDSVAETILPIGSP